MITICCKCKEQIKIASKWYKVNREDVMFLEKDPRSHGYCPECFKEARDKILEDVNNEEG